MKVTIIGEHGYYQALLGIGLSYGLTSKLSFKEFMDDDYGSLQRTINRSRKLARLGGAHAKFLESIVVWLDVDAPRYWWQEFDTYRVGVTKQSESTMHTILKGYPLTFDDFEDIPLSSLEAINGYIAGSQDLQLVKNVLPEGFLQRRIVCTNYKALAHIYHQRKNHKLVEWTIFLRELEKLTDFDYIENYGQGGTE